jgi:hypothetical protein
MMTDEARRRHANPAYRLARWTLPWIALSGVIYLVWVVWSGFPAMQAESVANGNDGAASSTAEASSTIVLGMTGIVTGEKLVLLDLPGAGGAELGTLSQDEPFEVVEKRGSWYKIRDGEGHLGWVLPDPAVVKIEAKQAP